MEVRFSGEVWYWRGPSPWHFVTVPEDESDALREGARSASYGWGMIPVTASFGRTQWTTSLFPKDGLYVVPIKTWVRRAESVELGDVIDLTLKVDV